MELSMKKNHVLWLCFLLLNICLTMCNNPIKFVCTAALIPKEYESRKNQYINSLTLLNKYNCDLYVIESIANGPTFLDDYCKNVCYTHSNNTSILNRGINEAISMKIGLKYFNFEPGTMVIKFTGRYQLKSDEFIKFVAEHMDADVIARAWKDNDAYTALFAMKIEYFLDFLDNYIDYQKWISYSASVFPTPFEIYFGSYITKIKKEGAKIVYLEKLYDYMPIWAYPYRF